MKITVEKSLMAIVVASVMVLAFGFTVSAAALDNLEYEVNGDEVTITGYTEGLAGELNIPGEIEGKPVTAIGYEAFCNCDTLTWITVPASVKAIGKSAFYECDALESVSLKEGLTIIDDNAFQSCIALKSVVIPSTVKIIGCQGFECCYGLESVTIPEGVEAIKSSAFWGCNSLTEVTIPSTVKNIGKYAFYNCDSLRSVTISEGVESIGGEAFYDCDALTDITIPSSVKVIGYDAFDCCSRLNSVIISEGVEIIREYVFEDCDALETIYIPSTLKEVGYGAFSYTPWLEAKRTESAETDHLVIENGILIEGKGCFGKVIIPDGVTCIGENAFSYCEEITDIVIPESVTNFGWFAFDGTQWIEDQRNLRDDHLVIVNNIVIDGQGCSGRIKIPEGVTGIASGAFYGCVDLTGVELPESVTSIGLCAFYGCDALAEINIPSKVKTIGDYAFCECETLDSVIIPQGLELLGEGAFFDCDAIKTVTVPSSVKTIKYEAFCECDGLESVTIYEGVESIEDYVFEYCDVLSEIILPASVENIECHAFFGCDALEFITILNPTAYIESDAIGNCKKLKAIYGYAGSTAEYYAKINDIAFEIICDHNMTEHPDKDATCTEEGNTAYWSCDKCGKYFNDGVGKPKAEIEENSWITKAEGHNMTEHPAIEVSCKKPGNTAYWSCDKCKKYFADAEGKTETEENSWIIPAGHLSDDGVITKEATETETGRRVYSCIRCGAILQIDILPKLEPAPAPVPEPLVNPFKDVKENHFFYDAVLWAVDEGITSGTDGEHFSPDMGCTRAHIVTFLWNVAGKPGVSSDVKNPFVDVKDNAYYYDAVLWAVEKGITAGIDASHFAPDLICTRGQAVSFLWRHDHQPKAGVNNPFNDVKAGVYYYEPVLWAVEQGITVGMRPGVFDPDRSCTRAQIVCFLYRFMQNSGI